MSKHSFKEKYLIFKVRQTKDAAAYGELYDYYVDRIFRFILFKVATQEEAEDLTSEVFLKTWEYINKTGKRIQNLNALFYRVARNCVIDFYRSRQSNKQVTDEEYLEQIQDERDMERELNTKVEIQNLQQYLKKLKDVYREVLILKYIEEFSISEIANITEKSKGNVRVLLHRATQALKDLMEE